MNARIASYADRQVYAADATPRYFAGSTVKEIPYLLDEDWFLRDHTEVSDD